MTFPPILSGPIPLYNNPPIQPQNFRPSRFVISEIALGLQTLVTTTKNHNYVIGQLVRLLIPQIYQMIGSGEDQFTIPVISSYELNETESYVIAIPSPNQVLLNLNSQNANPFSSLTGPQQPQVVAVGDILNGQINTHGIFNLLTDVPGSFRNISNFPEGFYDR